MRIFIDSGREPTTNRLVETETATVEENLIDVLHLLSVNMALFPASWGTYRRANSPEQTSRALVLQNDLHAMENTLIFLGRLRPRLQLSL